MKQILVYHKKIFSNAHKKIPDASGIFYCSSTALAITWYKHKENLKLEIKMRCPKKPTAPLLSQACKLLLGSHQPRIKGMLQQHQWLSLDIYLSKPYCAYNHS